VIYGTGMMTNVSNVLDGLLRVGDGAIDGIVKRLGDSVDRVEDRLFDRETALEAKRARLTATFVALEQAMARAQSTQEWLTAQLGALQAKKT
jgi:flagellar capping protein FliD